ncbi:MAG: HlyD family efflux transporter periplasmic adaptor subunit [Gammaproteobacteria bacterium]
MPDNEKMQTQIEGLATLLVLDEEIRKLTTIREFGFFSTNETHRLLPYHTAYLWQLKEFIGTHLVAQSGTAEIDIHATANQWLLNKINKIRLSTPAREIHQITFEQSLEENLAANPESPDVEWPEELPHYLLWCPLLNKSNQLTGGLIFFREVAFEEPDVKMLRWLIASFQYTWLQLVKSKKIPHWTKLKEKPYFIGATLLILGIIFFPTRLSVIGDGTVAPKSPVLINAPMQGVIKSFAVSPGELVKAGQLLLTIDKTDLQAAVEVSKKDFLLTQAKLRTAINEGFDNKNSRVEIPIIQAQLAIDKANLDYSNELLAKADVTSPISGIVIFDSKEDWVGQPIRTGERILIVADPKQVELKVIIPVTSSIELSIDDKGQFFLFGHLNSLPVRLKTLGYNAKLMPNKVLAYQLKADFTDLENLPQLGEQGTVKIYGNYVPLIYYVLRRPLQAFRQTLGI